MTTSWWYAEVPPGQKPAAAFIGDVPGGAFTGTSDTRPRGVLVVETTTEWAGFASKMWDMHSNFMPCTRGAPVTASLSAELDAILVMLLCEDDLATTKQRQRIERRAAAHGVTRGFNGCVLDALIHQQSFQDRLSRRLPRHVERVMQARFEGLVLGPECFGAPKPAARAMYFAGRQPNGTRLLRTMGL